MAYACLSCLVVADFNRDGKPDLAFNLLLPPPYRGVLLGNGDGTFGPALPLSYPEEGPIHAGDFDGDGIPDLFTGNGLAGVLRGKGDGTFQPRIDVNACSSMQSVSIQVGDFNRDGKTDILCGTALLLSNGDGSFRASGSVGSVAMESVVLVADFNGDGVPDVLLRKVVGHPRRCTRARRRHLRR